MADAPKSFAGIMVSSTFTDLEGHRQEVIDAIAKLGFHPVVMEYSGANAAEDVIGASLEMVRDCSAYVLVISYKYGQTPVDPVRNPDCLSITELEFNEAVKLNRPRLLFIMGGGHLVLPANVETDAAKIAKRDAFKERAKGMCPAANGSSVHCVYEVFDSKEALGKSAAIALGKHAVWLATKSNTQAGQSTIDPAEFAKLLEAVRADAERKDIGTQAVLALASKVAENVPDTATAIAELNNALDEYLRIRENAAKGSNFSVEIDAAINRVQAKIAANDFDAALAQGEAEYRLLEDKEAELSAAKIKLAQTNIATARIAYDATTMARWIAVKLQLESGGSEITATQLRVEQDIWYRKSLNHGSRLDMDVAIALARLSAGATDDPQMIARCQNDLGIALQVQGERQGGEAGLLVMGEAVTALRAALEVCTRDDLPVDWAKTQNNLGNALRVQGARQGGEAGLLLMREAVTALRAALEVRTRDDLPVDWAMTQNSLGAALSTQGERQGGKAGLLVMREAVTAFRAALEVYTRDDMPVQWAMTRENVGLVLQAMARLDAPRRCELLREAREEIAASLEVFTPDHMPFNWEKATRSLADIDAEIAKDC